MKVDFIFTCLDTGGVMGRCHIDIGTAPLLPLAPPPPQSSNPQHHMSSGTNAGTTHQPHYHYHAAPPIPRRFPRQAPRTPSLFPLLFSPARNTYPAIPMPVGPINQIAITTGPRPTHGGHSPPALHQPANHPQINNSAYPHALKRGGRRRRTPPTTTTITGNTSTRTQTINKSGQLTLLNPSPRH